MKLDRPEQEIEDNILEYTSVSARRREEVDAILSKGKERKSVNLRLSSFDLDLLKRKAEQEGIPYQTLISSILHKFVTDQLVDQKNIVKSVQLLKYG